MNYCKAYLQVMRMWRETSLLEPRPLAVIGWLAAQPLAGLTASGGAVVGALPWLPHKQLWVAATKSLTWQNSYWPKW